MHRALLVIAALFTLAACGGSDAVDARLVGTWQSSTVANSLPVTMRLTIDANGQYTTTFYSQLPLPNDSGTLAASDGDWRMKKITGGVEEGTYELVTPDSVLFEARTGPVLWTRVQDAAAAPTPNAQASGNGAASNPDAARPAPAPPPVLFNPGPDRPARAATNTAPPPPAPRPSSDTAPRVDLTDPRQRQEANMRAREEAARRSRETAQ